MVQTEIFWGSNVTCDSYLKWLIIITKACMNRMLRSLSIENDLFDHYYGNIWSMDKMKKEGC